MKYLESDIEKYHDPLQVNNIFHTTRTDELEIADMLTSSLSWPKHTHF